MDGESDEPQFQSADKVWLYSGIVGAIVSLYKGLHHIPHHGDSFILWWVLAFIVSLLVVLLKLDRYYGGFSTWVLTLSIVIIGFVSPVLIADRQLNNKARLITADPIAVTAEVVAVRSVRIPSTKYYHQNIKNAPLEVVYRYSVGGSQYEEAYYVDDNKANRDNYRQGAAIEVRYAATAPSVSEIVGPIDEAQDGAH